MATFKERIDGAKADIDALVTYANETTGEADETISDAVDSLVSGYGGGSGGFTCVFETTFEVSQDYSSGSTSICTITNPLASKASTDYSRHIMEIVIRPIDISGTSLSDYFTLAAMPSTAYDANVPRFATSTLYCESLSGKKRGEASGAGLYVANVLLSASSFIVWQRSASSFYAVAKGTYSFKIYDTGMTWDDL